MIGGIHPMLMTPVGGGVLKPQDVFATSLYTGTGSAQTINCGFQPDLVWYKDRSVAQSHFLVDALRGGGQSLSSNLTDAQSALGVATSFLPTGFTTSSNNNGTSKVAWSIKRAAKFFDVVTYTGNGVAERQIAHALGVAPGMVIVKAASSSPSINDWMVQHRSLGGTQNLKLNLANAAQTSIDGWNNTAAGTTTFTVYSNLNASGVTYVAYLFAHDTDASGIIQSGSYVGNAGAPGPSITLGWRPQFVLVKKVSNVGDWHVIDNVRSTVTPLDRALFPNLPNAETSSGIGGLFFLSSSFRVSAPGALNGNGDTYLYLAIREPIL